MPLPRCFFDIAINGVPTGRIVFELYSDVCPKTCENFRCLSTGEKGEGKSTFKPLHFKGTPIHRIVKGFIIQGGDFVNGDGTGGESIYGGLFSDESFKLKHDQGFLLSMANKGPDTNGSQFFITTAPAPHLDGIHVVFGRVVDGQQFVTEMENQKVDANHRPYADVRITNCGELVLLRRGKKVKSKHSKVVLSSESSSEENSSDSESESSPSEDERKKRKRRRKKRHRQSKKKSEKRSRKEKKQKKHSSKKHRKRRHKNSDSDKSSGSSEGEGEGEGEAVGGGVAAVSTISPGDLPDEGEKAGRPSWLYRSSRSPSPQVNKEETMRRTFDKPSFVHRNEVSHSGRKIKGRGLMRYRTPPRESDYHRTETQQGFHDGRARWERDQTGRDSRHRSHSRERRSTWRHRSRSHERQRRERSRSRERQHDRRHSNERRRERSHSNDHERDRSRHHDRQRSRSSERKRSQHHRDWESRDRSSREYSTKNRERSPSSRDKSSRTVRNSESSSHSAHTNSQRECVPEKQDLIEEQAKERPCSSSVLEDEKTQARGSWSYNHDDTWHSTSPRVSRWDRRDTHSSHDSNSSSSSASADEEDRELEQAYQNVERTLAEQQFGISSLFD